MRGDHGGVERLGRAATSRWQILFTASCALLLANVVAAEPPATKVEWRESRLSVTAEKAEIVNVLEAVQAKTRLEIQGLERLQGLPEQKRTISVSFENLPLADGLRTLLADFSYGLVEFYKPKPGTPGVLLYVATQGGILSPAKDEPSAGPQRTQAGSVTVHVEDESGAPIAPVAAPEQLRAVSPPQMRPDERTTNKIAQQQNSRPAAPESSTAAGQPQEHKGSDSAAADHAQTDAK
jgi:hypothetical protein